MKLMKHGRCLSVIALAISLLLSPSLHAEDQAKSGFELVEELKAKAQETNRPVLVIVETATCGYCHRLNGILDSRRVSRILDKKIDIVGINAYAPDAHKATSKIKPMWGGVPRWWFMAPDGSCSVNSIHTDEKGKEGNMGLPVMEPEIDQFIAGVESVAELTPKEKKKLKREWMDATEHSRERILREREKEAKKAKS